MTAPKAYDGSHEWLTEPDGPSDLTRRERRKLEVRNRILEASVTLFEAQGIDATTVAEITERADVAQKTFFNHFQSKSELLREIARHGLDQLLADIEEARKQPVSTAGRIQHFFACVAENADRAGPMHRELLSEIVRAAHGDGAQPEQARRLHDAFGALVMDGLAAGDLAERHSPETLTEMLMGAYYVLMFNWANLERYPLHARALETAGFLIDAMTTGGADRGESPSTKNRGEER